MLRSCKASQSTNKDAFSIFLNLETDSLDSLNRGLGLTVRSIMLFAASCEGDGIQKDPDVRAAETYPLWGQGEICHSTLANERGHFHVVPGSAFCHLIPMKKLVAGESMDVPRLPFIDVRLGECGIGTKVPPHSAYISGVPRTEHRALAVVKPPFSINCPRSPVGACGTRLAFCRAQLLQGCTSVQKRLIGEWCWRPVFQDHLAVCIADRWPAVQRRWYPRSPPDDCTPTA